MLQTLNPSEARKNFYSLIKEMNVNSDEIRIVSSKPENNCVIIGLDDWEAIKETLYLESTGTLAKVRERENHPNGFIDVDEIDWNEYWGK